MIVHATAYCLEGRTYLGTRPHYGVVAVDPRVIPLRSSLVIKGQRFRAEDTGADIRGRRIDIYMSDCAEATRYGVRKISVQVIQKKPSEIFQSFTHTTIPLEGPY